MKRRNPRKTSTMNSNSSISSSMNTPNMLFLRSAVATLLAAGSLAANAQAATLAERSGCTTARDDRVADVGLWGQRVVHARERAARLRAGVGFS